MQMKYPINYLSKEDQKKIYQNYKKTPTGQAQLARLLRLIVTGVLSILLSIYLLVTNYQEHTKWFTYLIPIVLLIAGLTFIISSFILKRKSLNTYYVKNKRSSRQ